MQTVKCEKNPNVLYFLHEGERAIKLSASKEAFAQAKEWITEALAQLHAVPHDSNQIIIVADEIFSNIVSYAYMPEDASKTIEMTLSFDREKLLFTMMFADCGIAFNPLEQDVELPRERLLDRIPGGIGLFLVRQFMDELNYHRENQRNVLTISKVLHLEGSGIGSTVC